jgi:hypothetical protein
MAWRALAITIAAALSLTACAARNSYMGIPLAPGTAPTDLQALASRAKDGDKQSQLDLGIRFEEGKGLAVDLKRARALYQLAAAESGGTQWVYVPPSKDGGRGQNIPVIGGPKRSGSFEAKIRLASINGNQKELERLYFHVISSKTILINFSLIDSASETKAVCDELNGYYKSFYASKKADCTAYKFKYKYRGSIAYFYTISIDIDESIELDRASALGGEGSYLDDPFAADFAGDRVSYFRGSVDIYEIKGTSGAIVRIGMPIRPERHSPRQEDNSGTEKNENRQ